MLPLTIDDNNAGAADINVVPVADNNGNVGTAAKRWKLVRAVTITPGRLTFADDTTGIEVWAMHEDADFLYIQELTTWQDVAKFDRDGNLYLRGEVRPWK